MCELDTLEWCGLFFRFQTIVLSSNVVFEIFASAMLRKRQWTAAPNIWTKIIAHLSLHQRVRRYDVCVFASLLKSEEPILSMEKQNQRTTLILYIHIFLIDLCSISIRAHTVMYFSTFFIYW